MNLNSSVLSNYLVSIIIPVYNEEENILPLLTAIKGVMSNIRYEVIFVDDASNDFTLDILRTLSRENANLIRYISLTRNFGHQNALKKGLFYATGDCAITMDGDMQHPPSLLPLMLKEWQNGFKVVAAKRKKTENLTLFKKLTSFVFYKLANLLSDVSVPEGVADFRLLDRVVIDHLNNLREVPLFIRGVVAWLGFDQKIIEYNQPERFAGHSKYTIRKMFSLALAGITSFSVKPLRISMTLGSFFSVIAFLYGFYAIAMHLRGVTLAGWTSVLVSVVFMGGIQLISLGIIGEYIGKIHLQVKDRPSSIVKEIFINESFSAKGQSTIDE